VIGKRTLAIIETLRPAPGKSAAHGEVDKVGTYALVSICETDGAVVVYDTKTLQGVERLPMVKRSGKYNVHNKVDRSRGTSH
jgi:DNA/RNA endonuclease YhcR with UshA esterase domain